MKPKRTYALVSPPPDTLADALRMKELGAVDVALAGKQHAAYCRALQYLGYSLLTLPADDRYPDGVFVEDPAVIIRDALVTARLRRAERQGEEQRVTGALREFFTREHRIEPPGFVEGGDVIVTEGFLCIGISQRTNRAGAEQLARIAKEAFGFFSLIVEVPEAQLHLKGAATYHQELPGSSGGLLFASEEVAQYFSTLPCRVLETPAGERFSANCISRNGTVFMHARCPRTKTLLERSGLHVFELDMSEFEKIDGALSCLSKLFTIATERRS